MVVDGRRLNYQNIRRGFGDGGFQSEGEEYTLECSYVAFDYDLAYRNVFGTDLTGQPDIADFVPRYVETVVFTGQHDPRRPGSRSSTRPTAAAKTRRRNGSTSAAACR